MTELNYTLPNELSKRYHLLSLLGSGGAGKVFKAKDSILDTVVAIKVLNVASDERKILRLQREAIVLGKLKHKNITGIIDFNIVEDVPYIIAEFVEGKTLSSLIENNELDFNSELEIAIQVCKALSYAHGQGIVHRDIKPENIMVTRDDNNELLVKVLDFGMAKSDQDDQFLTTSGSFIGTPLYASPEQFKGKKTDYKTDLYSLGCLLFYLFSKSVPYKAENTIRAADMHLNNPIPELAHDELSSETISVIKSCLEKNPDNRPANVDLILESFNPNSIIEEEELTTEESRTKSKIPRNVLALSILGLVTTGSILLISIFNGWQPGNNEAAKNDEKQEQKQKKPDSPLPDVQIDDSPMIQEENKFSFKYNEYGLLTARAGRVSTDRAFKKLTGKNFQVLNLWHNSTITGEGFKYLESCPITNLVLSKTKLEEKNLVYLSKIKSVRHIIMHNCPTLSNKAIELLQPLKDLETISFTSPKLSDDGLKYIASFKKLNHLTFGGSKNIDDGCMDYINKLTNLETLGLPDTAITPRTIAQISMLKNVKALSLAGNKILDKNSTILDLVKINPIRLDIGDTNISDSGLAGLARANNITYLNLSKTNVSAKGIKHLAKLPNLKELNLSKTSLGSASIQELAKLNLISLDLSDTNLLDQQLNLLTEIKSLKHLKIANCPGISTSNVAKFKQYFEKSNGTKINVSN